jgi:predicted nucleotidyltransferase
MNAVSEQLEVLRDVVAKLDAAGIEFMVSGSVALNYYAQPRMTRDIDIVIELPERAVETMTRAFADEYYVDAESVQEAARTRGMFNFIHLGLLLKVDFIVRRAGPYRELEFARRRRVEWEGVAVHVVSAEDLLLSKLAWARESHSEMQLGDARNLLESVEELDMEYVQKWARTLRVDHLLEEIGR